MKIKVTIEFEDGFENNQIAVSGIENQIAVTGIDHIDNNIWDSQLEFISTYVINAIVALGFEKGDVKKYFKECV